MLVYGPALAAQLDSSAGRREMQAELVRALTSGPGVVLFAEQKAQGVVGVAPETQAELLWRAVQEGWPAATLADELTAQAARRAAA